MMKGIGYGHPQWTHGGWKGELVVEREDFRPADLDPLDMSNLHIQAIAKAVHDQRDWWIGRHRDCRAVRDRPARPEWFCGIGGRRKVTMLDSSPSQVDGEEFAGIRLALI